MKKLLIIATSARMLAHAARNSEIIPFVIDCYGDQDTQQLAEHYQQVKSLSIADLYPAIEFFKHQNITQLVYGSGFEQYSDSLLFLAQHFEILGNASEIFIALQNKRDFFQRLQQLNIKFPEVRFTMPETPEAWLVKSQHSQGGLNIQLLSNTILNSATKYNYFQRYIKGESLSVLFLANGKHAQIVGFNQQLTTSLGNQPFVFAGIINQAKLSLTQQHTLTFWVNQLTESYGLRGLNSLDFILADTLCFVLEINPRPPASMQLYHADLLTAHLYACSGQLDNRSFKTKNYTAYQIIYAQKPTLITGKIRWLRGCVDIPAINTIIDTWHPICSIIASKKNLASVLIAIQLKKHLIFQQLS